MAKKLAEIFAKKEVVQDLWKINSDWLHSRYRRRHALKNKPDDFFAELNTSIKESAPCFFVLSTGRCGTKLLTDILRTNRFVDVHHKPSPELTFPSKLAYEEGDDHPNEFRRAAFMARYDLIEDSYIKDQIYAETNCRITFLAPYLSEIFGGSKFLHLVRDPVTFISSARARGYFQSERADRGHVKPTKGHDRILWDSMTINQKIAWNWNSTNKFVEEFKKTLPTDKYITARAEDLFNDPNVALSIFNFIGAEPPNHQRVRRLIGKPVNASQSGNVSRSLGKEDLKKEVEEFTSLASNYGYGLNR